MKHFQGNNELENKNASDKATETSNSKGKLISQFTSQQFTIYKCFRRKTYNFFTFVRWKLFHFDGILRSPWQRNNLADIWFAVGCSDH